jgi:hypothetical protein
MKNAYESMFANLKGRGHLGEPGICEWILLK